MTNPNDAAFSKAAFYHPDGGIDTPQEGLTKREYFAAMALQGMVASGCSMDFLFQKNAETCIIIADAIIKALNER
jgi:hypothetical protein